MKLKEENITGSGIESIPFLGPPFIDVLPDGEIDYESIHSNFVWGVGFKATYDLPKDWIIGLDAQYLRHKHDYSISSRIVTLAFAGGPPLLDVGYMSWDGTLTIYEWQIAP